MGWMQLVQRPNPTNSPSGSEVLGKALLSSMHVEHVEDVKTSPSAKAAEQKSGRVFPFADSDLPNERLPFISKELVLASMCIESSKSPTTRPFDHHIISRKELWIVVDNIVYDCSEFVAEHPGGEHVISSFAGQDCTWQFWRFHGPKEMEQYGRPLRIGKTEGVKNRFSEPVRYVGLRPLGDNDW